MHRRQFIEAVTASSLGAAWGTAASAVGADRAEMDEADGAPPKAGNHAQQRLHPDAQTDPAGVEYFVLGNGRIIAIVQHATGAAQALGQTPLGLLLWDPHHFARKWSTFTFHPEWGLARGLLSVRVGDAAYSFDAGALEVTRHYPDGVPVVEARWQAGPHPVVERYWVAEDAPVLVREVALHVSSGVPRPVTFTTALYGNHVLFSGHHTGPNRVAADGYARISLHAEPPGTAAERYLSVEAGTAAAGQPAMARLVYAIGEATTGTSVPTATPVWAPTVTFWEGRTTIATGEDALDDLYRAARDGLRAAASTEGRFDASIWQYNMEWTVDAAGVLMAAARTGQFELAGSVLDNLCTRLVDAEGYTAQASRFRHGEGTELNQNGALLGAAWTYWAWSGDTGRIRAHWDVLRRVGELPLRPAYLHPSGLVQASVELFERDRSAGVLPGFDVTHQALVSWGLERGSALAQSVGDVATAERWRTAGRRMREAYLGHPDLALVYDGRLVKRRLPDGRRQRWLVPAAVGSDHIPADSELARSGAARLDPDVGTLWPILLGQVDPDSPLARQTLAEVGSLWNRATGGYLRYHASGDPDAPGGWTFPTAIVGQVLAWAGDGAGVRRVLDWFTQIQGARGGGFFEIYADAARPVPPLPPMGLIVWGWAEIASLFVHGLLGARPDPATGTLRLDPHLPDGLDRLTARLRLPATHLTVRVDRAAQPSGRYRGQALTYDGGFRLPLDATGTVALSVS